MLSLISKCTVDSMEIPRIAEARIVSDRTASTDTATIVFPKLKARPSDFSEGQRIELYLGYSKYGLFSEFSGVIGGVSPTVPIELVCYDNFHLLRRKTLNRSFSKMSIADILRQVVPDLQIVCDEPPKVTAHCPGQTPRWFIMQLATKYGFNAFFRDGKLHFLKPESSLLDDGGEPPVFVENETILEDHLVYRTAETVTKVVVISESEDGYIARAGYGAKSTNVRTVQREGLGHADAYKYAKQLYEELNYEGFTGHFITLGYPYVRHGMTCAIESATDGKSGVYRIEKAETSFGTGGFRRAIYLGKRTGTWQAKEQRKRISE